jgi:hypothetical protein
MMMKKKKEIVLLINLQEKLELSLTYRKKIIKRKLHILIYFLAFRNL